MNAMPPCLPIPFAWLSLPGDMQQEILYPCTARDITHLACVSVAMHDALRQHPVIRAFTHLAPPCRYTALVGGMDAIQSTPLRFRATLMCEYASRMAPIEDGNGAIPWLYYLRLCERQLQSQFADSDPGSDLRDLCIAQPGAMLSLLKDPSRAFGRVYAWEAEIRALPQQYRADLYDALLRLNVVTSSADRQVWDLVDGTERDGKRVALRFIGVMAALQLFDGKARDVCHCFTEQFGLNSEARASAFESIVVEALAACFPQRGDDLSNILPRWGTNHLALVSPLHEALLQKAAAISRRRWGVFPDVERVDRRLPSDVQATDQVLAIHATAETDLAIVRASMATFWTLYWSSDRALWGAACRATWETVLRMPWQIQPTLLCRLICQNGLARVNLDKWWGQAGSGALWEQDIFAKCIASAFPRLAVRALMVAVHLARSMPRQKQAAVLQRVWTQAFDALPPWSWSELIEGLCLFCIEAKRLPEAHGPIDASVGKWMSTFLSDQATYMLAPSPMYVATLIDHAESIWRFLPEGDGGSRFERLCDRLDLAHADRERLGVALKPCFTSETF